MPHASAFCRKTLNVNKKKTLFLYKNVYVQKRLFSGSFILLDSKRVIKVWHSVEQLDVGRDFDTYSKDFVDT